MSKIPIGPTTIGLVITAVLGAIPVVVKLFEAKGILGPEVAAAVLSIASVMAAALGRYAQAHAAIKVGK